MSVFHDRANELRKESGEQAKDVADALGISQSKFSYYMSGRSEPPYSMLIDLANHYNVTTDYLVGRSALRNAKDEIIAKNIQNAVEHAAAPNRNEDIESTTIKFYEILNDYAKAETDDDSLDDVWNAIHSILEGLRLFQQFIVRQRLSSEYPIDMCMEAIGKIRSSINTLNNKRITNYLYSIVHSDSVPAHVKSRVVEHTSYFVKSKRPEENVIDANNEQPLSKE